MIDVSGDLTTVEFVERQHFQEKVHISSDDTHPTETFRRIAPAVLVCFTLNQSIESIHWSQENKSATGSTHIGQILTAKQQFSCTKEKSSEETGNREIKRIITTPVLARLLLNRSIESIRGTQEKKSATCCTPQGQKLKEIRPVLWSKEEISQATSPFRISTQPISDSTSAVTPTSDLQLLSSQALQDGAFDSGLSRIGQKLTEFLQAQEREELECPIQITNRFTTTIMATSDPTAPSLAEEDIPEDMEEEVDNNPEEDDLTVQGKRTTRTTTKPSRGSPTPSISSMPKQQELVLKWVFKPTDARTTLAQIQTTHAYILQVMKDKYPGQIQVIGSNNRMINSDDLLNVNQHATMFRVHQKRAKGPKISTVYEIYHRIQSTVQLKTLRSQPEVQQRLKASFGRVAHHHWLEDETDVKDLGWFITYNPGHGLNTQMTQEIRKAISVGAQCKDKNIPRFVCYRTNVSAILQRVRRTTDAYGIQCRANDTGLLMRQLQKTYIKSNKFLFYSSRDHHPEAYAKAILSQNKYLSKSRVVAIAGVPPDTMWSFESYLKAKEPRIIQVWETPKTQSDGRYNLETTVDNMRPLARFLNDNLERIYLEFLADPTTSGATTPHCDDMPMPYMASRMSLGETGSEGSEGGNSNFSFASVGTGYYSTCSISLSPYEEYMGFDDQEGSKIPHPASKAVPPIAKNYDQQQQPAAAAAAHPPTILTYSAVVQKGSAPQQSDHTSTMTSEELSNQKRVAELELQLLQMRIDKQVLELRLAQAEQQSLHYQQNLPLFSPPPDGPNSTQMLPPPTNIAPVQQQEVLVQAIPLPLLPPERRSMPPPQQDNYLNQSAKDSSFSQSVSPPLPPPPAPNPIPPPAPNPSPETVPVLEIKAIVQEMMTAQMSQQMSQIQLMIFQAFQQQTLAPTSSGTTSVPTPGGVSPSAPATTHLPPSVHFPLASGAAEASKPTPNIHHSRKEMSSASFTAPPPSSSDDTETSPHRPLKRSNHKRTPVKALRPQSTELSDETDTTMIPKQHIWSSDEDSDTPKNK